MAVLNKAKFITVAAIVIAALGIIAAASAIGLVNTRELSPDQAEDAVKGFAKVDAIKSIVKDEFGGKRPVYEIQTNDDRVFWVDAKTGKVTGVVGKLDAEPVNTQELPLTKDAALNRAEAYLKGKYDHFEELKLTKTEVGPGDSVSFQWEVIDENGARLPRWVMLSVDLKTGKLGGYASRDDETVISTKPRILKTEAINIANAKLSSGMVEITINDCDLIVMKDKSGQQRLSWVVSYTKREKDQNSSGLIAVSEDQLCIDAGTGDAITSDFQ